MENLRGFIGSPIDVTDRKEADEALRQAEPPVDEFLAMLGQNAVCAILLGIIIPSVQLLRLKGPQEPALVELREMIERQTEHMSQMMNDLLDVSRITRGQVRKREWRDFAEIVRHAVEDHRSAVNESGLTLVSKVPDRPMWMMGDPMRLAQIVGNLLHNASKFTDPGGTLTIRLVEAPGGGVLPSVHDTGIGIETDMLKEYLSPLPSLITASTELAAVPAWAWRSSKVSWSCMAAPCV